MIGLEQVTPPRVNYSREMDVGHHPIPKPSSQNRFKKKTINTEKSNVKFFD